MNETYSLAFFMVLLTTTVYGVSVDIFPAGSVLVNQGQKLEIVCSNIKPSNWYSLTITLKCGSIEIDEVTASNSASSDCVQSILSPSSLGETSFSCNIDMFVFSVSRVPIGVNDCSLGCLIFAGSRGMNYTTIEVKEPLTGPTIKPNEEQIILETDTKMFQCTSTSFPVAEIKWYINDRHIAAPSLPRFNFSTSSLTYKANRKDNDRKLYCTASNRYESSNSSNVILNITYLPDVTIHPNYTIYKVIKGTNDVTLHCSVTDANPAVYKYEWFRGSTIIDTKINHTLSNVSKADDGVYFCLATNNIGTTSKELRLVVLYGVQLTKIKTRQETEGTRLSVRCSGSSNPQFNDSDVKWTKENDSSFIKTGELVMNVSRDDSGIYICTVILSLVPSEGQAVNVTGTTTVQIDVLYVPTIHMEPEYNPYILYEGQQKRTIVCVLVDANPSNDVQYIWTYPKGSVNNNALTIPVVMKEHNGSYFCTAKNAAGNSTKIKKQIYVQYGPTIISIPNQNITEGQNLTVTSSVNAEPSNILIWWTQQNEIFKYSGSILKIPSIQRRSSGAYMCHAMNTLTPSGLQAMNRTSSMLFHINVLYVPETHITPIYSRYILYEGQHNIVLQCVVDDANPNIDITYYWTKPTGTVTGNTLIIKNVEKYHDGVYKCIANNKAGSSKPAIQEIEVQYAPSISDIYNQTITEGETLMIVPTIEAKPDIASSWWTRESENFRFNGVNLTLDDIQRTSSDYYTIHVENILTPSNSTVMNKISEKKVFVDVQYPPSVEIMESKYHQVVEHDTLSLHCTVKDANPPAAMVKWNSTGSDTANFTVQNIRRTEAGNYTCNAVNAVGVGSENVYVDVLYVPNVTLLRILNGSMVAENTTVVIQCSIDSNPRSTVQWNINNRDKTEVLIGTTSSYYTISTASCFDTGAVECTATNEIFYSVYNATKQIPLYVSCSPRLDRYREQPDDKLGLPTGGNLNLTVYLVAYPRPSKMTWNFRQNHTSNTIRLNSNDTNTDVFRHTVYLLKVNLTEQEFGFYTLDVKNDIGVSSTTFYIVPEGPPEQSKILNTSCIGEQATVFWETSFNGGETQHFYLIVFIEDKEYKTVQTGIMSETKEEVKHKTITLSNGYYSFRVLGKNQYGNATSLEAKSCSIKGNTKTEDSSVVAKAAGGGIGAAVVLIGAIAMVFLILKNRRTSKGKHQDTGRSKLTDEDKNDDDGLKDNPLYGTSQDTNDNNRDVYSQVNKLSKSSECDEDVIDGGTVYSQVQKKPNKKKKQKDMEMGNIYENSDKIMKGHHTDKIYAKTGSDAAREKSKNGQSYQPKQNKDGLVYADLDLAPCGKRFVIRGIENRNNYALIDLTKTAEPLPSDDDDNEEDNKNHESTTAVVE